MEKSETIGELAKALIKVQAELQPAVKGQVNPYFKSSYANLLEIWEVCRKPLTDNGLSVTQIAESEEGKAILETVLMHESGEWIKGRLPLMPIKQDPQGQGSAITYARRYSLAAIVGVSTEDDDAEAATSHKVNPAATAVKEVPDLEPQPLAEKIDKDIVEAIRGDENKPVVYANKTQLEQLTALHKQYPGEIEKLKVKHGFQEKKLTKEEAGKLIAELIVVKEAKND